VTLVCRILADLFELRITHLEHDDRCAAPASAAERPPELFLEWYGERRNDDAVLDYWAAQAARQKRTTTGSRLRRACAHFPPCPYLGGDGQLYTASGVGRITDVTETRRPYQPYQPRSQDGRNARVASPHSAPNLGSCRRWRGIAATYCAEHAP
jgi:hypothetical protein